MVNIPQRGLGQKTFIFILLKYGWALAIPILGIFILILGSSLAPEAVGAANEFGGIVIGLGVLMIFGAFGIAWLEYSHYGIALDESTFRTTHGIVALEELGFPYRHIREAVIRRSISEQVFGMSTLVVTIAGENDEDKQEVLLPWLDKDLASELRDALLKKSEIEQMHIASSAI